jgi:hypothetical protein
MTKEGRFNLIFFSVLLVLMLPGFLILMSRKLGGTSDPNYMPNPLQHVAAYMQPPPIPPTVPRTEPQAVRDWVTKLLHDRVDSEASLARSMDGGPAIGDRFRSQVVHVQSADPSRYRVVVLIWSSKVRQDGQDAPTVRVEGLDLKHAIPPMAEAIDVPKDIRRALQKVGYIDPPLRVAWIDTMFVLSGAETLPKAVIVDATIDGKPVAERCVFR